MRRRMWNFLFWNRRIVKKGVRKSYFSSISYIFSPPPYMRRMWNILFWKRRILLLTQGIVEEISEEELKRAFVLWYTWAYHDTGLLQTLLFSIKETSGHELKQRKKYTKRQIHKHTIHHHHQHWPLKGSIYIRMAVQKKDISVAVQSVMMSSSGIEERMRYFHNNNDNDDFGWRL